MEAPLTSTRVPSGAQAGQGVYRALFLALDQPACLVERVAEGRGGDGGGSGHVPLRCLECNEAFVRVFGEPRPERMGHEPCAQVSAVLASGRAACFEWRDEAGGRNYHVQATPLPGAERRAGAPARAALLFTDVTGFLQAQEALRRSEASARAILDMQAEMVCRFRPDGTILYVNAAYAAARGASPEELRSVNFWQFVAEVDRPGVRSMLASLRPEAPEVRIENRFETTAGPRWTLWTNRALAFDDHGVATEVQSTGVDITERRAAEEALREVREQLERSVARRTAELQQRAEQLARLSVQLTRAEQRERRRLAQLLHDHLQQLLVGAKLALALVSRHATDEQREPLTQVEELLAEAFTASRSLTVELSPPVLHEAGLGAGLAWLARWMRDKHGLAVELRGDTDADDRGDLAVLLFHAARELLFNVVKHAGVSAATVEVTRGDGRVSVSVSDDGRGVDPAAVVRTPGDVDGGFGLFSIRERLALLGGKFEVQGAPGEGARFTMSAPLPVGGGVAAGAPQAADPRVAPPNAGGPRGGRLRVLIVDDHAVVRRGLRALLAQEQGVEVVGEAADGAEAVELAARLSPDVALVDFSMPEMDGVACIARLRRLSPPPRCIGLSMYEEPDRAAAMIDAGAEAFLTKSCDSDELLAALYRATPR